MRRRSAFTLVEVLVSMALILFIMSILAAAFGAASQAVSDLKAAGDLAEKLRGATNVLKFDLEADHFTDSTATSVKLSDSSFWNRLTVPAPPSPVGFFRITEGGAATNEGNDLDGIPSYFQTNTSLSYTIALHGTHRSDFLSALVTGTSALLQPSPTGPYANLDNFYQDPVAAGASSGVFSSQFAEVEVFLGPTGDTTDNTTGPARPLFALYRRQQLAVPKSWTQTAAITAGEANFDYEMSMWNNAFNTMQDLSMPVKRFQCNGAAGLPPAGGYQPIQPPNTAADLLMTDVLSFDVRVLVSGGSDFEDLFQLYDNNGTNIPSRKNPKTGLPWYFPFNNNAFGGALVFDTWTNQIYPAPPAAPVYDYSNWQTAGTATSIPMFKDNNGNPISIQAIQITLRVWDFKTKKTRQVTIVQQM